MFSLREKNLRSMPTSFATKRIFGCLVAISLFGCKEKPTYKPSYSHFKPQEQKTLIMGCANPGYYEPFDITVQYINKKLKDVQLRTESASNYENYLSKIQKGAYDITYANGLEALNAQKYGYRIVAKFESDSTYYAVFFANKRANIKNIKDLKGKKTAFVGKGSINGELAPAVFLYQNGLNIYKNVDLIYPSSFESSILNVYLDKCDAGVSWVTLWNKYIKSHPEILKKVEIKWQTAPLPNICIIMKKDIKPQIAEKIVNLYLNLHKDSVGKQGLQALDFTKVIKVDSTVYDPLKKLKKEFDRIPK